ncbi:MAG: FecR family protein [Methylococcales bacterium]
MKPKPPTAEQAAILDAANAWWVRLDSDDLSTKERAEFAVWRDADPAHGRAFDAVCALWGELDAVEQRIRPPAKSAFPNANLRRRYVLALAAACLAVWLFSPLSIWLRADYRTGFGEIRDIHLADGSTVHLNSDTALKVNLDDHERRFVLLAGQAWFEVYPDPRRPFRVQAGPGTVTALGTAFDIRLRGESAQLSVTQHSVAVELSRDRESKLHTVVHEGQRVDYDVQSGIGAIQSIDSRTATAWQRGKLVFQNRPLGEVIEELGRYHHGYLVMTDSDLAQRRVNGVFDIHQPLAVLDALETSLKLHSTHLSDYLILLHR